MKNTLKVTTPGDREILLGRAFDAPRELVFETMARPELLQRWLTGPPGWTMTVSENDLRIGGTFRHVWRRNDGTEMAMAGVYREVIPPERIVRTESFTFGIPEGRAAGHHSPHRARGQDLPHGHRALSVEGSP